MFMKDEAVRVMGVPSKMLVVLSWYTYSNTKSNRTLLSRRARLLEKESALIIPSPSNAVVRADGNAQRGPSH